MAPLEKENIPLVGLPGGSMDVNEQGEFWVSLERSIAIFFGYNIVSSLRIGYQLQAREWIISGTGDNHPKIHDKTKEGKICGSQTS